MKSASIARVYLAFGIVAALLLALTIWVTVAAVWYAQVLAQRRAASERLRLVGEFLSLLKDAETGQRGYIITRDEEAYRDEYLEPYRVTLQNLPDASERLARAYQSAAGESQAKRLIDLAGRRMEIIERSLVLADARAPAADEELKLLFANRVGKVVMDEARVVALQLEDQEREMLEQLNARGEWLLAVTLGGSSLLGLGALSVVGGAAYLLARDIQRRQQIEGALRRERSLLNGVLNSMNEGVAVADERGKLILFNRAAERMLGQGPSDKQAEEWSAIYQVFRPDRTTPMPVAELPLVRALAGETVADSELYIVRPGEQEGRFLSCTAGPIIDDAGARRGGVVILRDVTDRRHADQRFQSLLESTPDALVLVDPQGIMRLVNQQAEELFGLSRGEMIGQAVEILLPERYRAGHPAQRDAYFSTPRVRAMGSGLELLARHRAGHDFPIEISLAPVPGDDGGVWACAAIRDVSERIAVLNQIRELNEQLEERVAQRTAELAAANEELLERNRENEMFVYSVSHDLRSPLVNLQGFSQELDGACEKLTALAELPETPPALRQKLGQILAADVNESIHFIRTSVTRLGGIIDALLRLSRAGRVVYQWQTVDMEAILRRIVDAAHATAQQQGATITIGALPAARGDATALEQIFGNLVQNALHYLDPARPGVIEIFAQQDGHHAGFCIYAVRDNGLGIAPEMHDKIFQAFQRLNPRQAPGEGMGLTLVQRIVSRHGGRIWVESAPGAGSTFFVSLPAAAGEAALDAAALPEDRL